MDIIKIMPCLDMKEGRIVKGIHFVDLKDAGDPVENAEFYQKEGADELAMLDEVSALAPQYPEWMNSLGDDRLPGQVRDLEELLKKKD